MPTCTDRLGGRADAIAALAADELLDNPVFQRVEGDHNQATAGGQERKRRLKPRTKRQVTLRLDSDVLDWFKKQGRGYQTRINVLLRAYMEEHQAQSTRSKPGPRRG